MNNLVIIICIFFVPTCLLFKCPRISLSFLLFNIIIYLKSHGNVQRKSDNQFSRIPYSEHCTSHLPLHHTKYTHTHHLSPSPRTCPTFFSVVCVWVVTCHCQLPTPIHAYTPASQHHHHCVSSTIIYCWTPLLHSITESFNFHPKIPKPLMQLCCLWNALHRIWTKLLCMLVFVSAFPPLILPTRRTYWRSPFIPRHIKFRT